MISPRSFSSRRPLKVERGRKKSELIPERRMEKKKGERAGASKAGHGRTEREGSQGWFPHPGEGEGSFQQGSLLVGPCQCCCDPCTVLESIYGVCRDGFPAGIPFPLGHTPACPLQSGPWGCFQPRRREKEPKPFLGRGSGLQAVVCSPPEASACLSRCSRAHCGRETSETSQRDQVCPEGGQPGECLRSLAVSSATTWTSPS